MTVLGTMLAVVAALGGSALIGALLWVDYQDERAHRALDVARRRRMQAAEPVEQRSDVPSPHVPSPHW